MAILSIHHLTRYRYRNPVALGEHRMMFRPLESYDQRVIFAALEISPEPSQLRQVHDVFGNCVGIATFAGRTRELVFESRVELEHTPVPAFAGVDGEIEPYTGAIPFAYSPEDMPDLLRSMERLHPDPDRHLEQWARKFVNRGGRTNLQGLLAEMTQAIHSDFNYAKRLYGAPQTPVQTLTARSGTCRDFAVLMMEAVRTLGLAAQFVSGYIYSPPRRLGGLQSVGGGHTHAWVRVYLPACGWVEFDPTNGIVGNADLVRVAIARDPRQALPLSGSWEGEADDFIDMEVEVSVTSDNDLGIAPSRVTGAQPELFRSVG
jgi:transglutaminase-like putative cysteine protease